MEEEEGDPEKHISDSGLLAAAENNGDYNSFVVNDVEEEEEYRGEENAGRQKKKKKRTRSGRNFELHQDDYELLEESRIQERKGLKRLKRMGRDTSLVDHSGFSDGDDGTEEFIVDDMDPNDDGMTDFIVDDTSGLASAMQEAVAIFGDVTQLLKSRRRVDDDVEAEEKYMLDKDEEIMQMDLPERIKISEDSTGTVEEEYLLTEESLWILNQLRSNMIPWQFWKRTMMQPDQGIVNYENGVNGCGNGGVNECSDGGADLVDVETLKQDIVRFLRFHHLEKLDIPVISMYLKKHCLSLLKMSELLETEKNEDTPKLKRNEVLWAIKELDTKWLLLHKRKRALHLSYEKRYEYEISRVHDKARIVLNQQLFESIVNSLKDAESDREVDDIDLKVNLHFPPCKALFKRINRKSNYSSFRMAGVWKVASKFGCSAEQFGLHITAEKGGAEALIDLTESPKDIALKFKCAMFTTPEAVLTSARFMVTMEISSEPRVRKYVRKFFMENAVVSTMPTSIETSSIDSWHPLAGVMWLHEKPLTKFEDSQWLFIEKAEKDLLKVTISLTESKMVDLLDSTKFYLSDGVSTVARNWNEQRKLILEDAFSNHLLPSMEKEARIVLAIRARKWALMQYGKQLWNKVSLPPCWHNAPKVMACCWDPNNPAITFVMLDSSGELVDILYAGLNSTRNYHIHEKKVEEQRLLKFMTRHLPHIVVLGASNSFCKQLKKTIFKIIQKRVEENPQDLSREMDGISVVYGDESLPRIYESSRISSGQLGTQPGIVKRAVALGRYLQNPLAMVSTLCGPKREILSWTLGSLDHFLSDDEKFEMIEQVMVDITNQVGVDVNLAARHQWLFAPLQFVSGLGPRKAMALRKAMVDASYVTSRKELAYLMTSKVFINAVDFLRVRCSGMVPPEYYDAVIAAEPNKMHAHGFQDWRTHFKKLSQEDEKCYLVSGENVDSLVEGKIVKAGISGEVDCYYKKNWTTLPVMQVKSGKPKLVKEKLLLRMILHPHFQTITVDQAIKFLSDKNIGKAVIYPSSSCFHLNLTVKMEDGIFLHKEIVEDEKHKDYMGLLRLGTSLRIDDEKYEDLDEVMDRYVDDLVTHLRSMLSHQKFKRGTKTEVDNLLKVEKSFTNYHIVYCFGICYRYPGDFILSYIRNRNPYQYDMVLVAGRTSSSRNLVLGLDLNT